MNRVAKIVTNNMKENMETNKRCVILIVLPVDI